MATMTNETSSSKLSAGPAGEAKRLIAFAGTEYLVPSTLSNEEVYRLMIALRGLKPVDIRYLERGKKYTKVFVLAESQHRELVALKITDEALLSEAEFGALSASQAAQGVQS